MNNPAGGLAINQLMKMKAQGLINLAQVSCQFRSLDALRIARTDALFCKGALFGEMRTRSFVLPVPCDALGRRALRNTPGRAGVLSPRGLRRTVKCRGRAGAPVCGR